MNVANIVQDYYSSRNTCWKYNTTYVLLNNDSKLSPLTTGSGS
jgi:hypothetical protein